MSSIIDQRAATGFVAIHNVNLVFLSASRLEKTSHSISYSNLENLEREVRNLDCEACNLKSFFDFSGPRLLPIANLQAWPGVKTKIFYFPRIPIAKLRYFFDISEAVTISLMSKIVRS